MSEQKKNYEKNSRMYEQREKTVNPKNDSRKSCPDLLCLTKPKHVIRKLKTKCFYFID